MFYYSHHIGDFIRDTARLNDAQCMAYLRLIWAYYDTEQPLDTSPEKLAFQIGAKVEDVKQILDHYFVFEDGRYFHSRCEKEITHFRNKSLKASESANARWKNPKAMRTHSERNTDESKSDANQEPRTNNQEPAYKEGKPSLSGSAFPTCPHQELLKLYGKHLPNLVQPRSWEGARQTNMKQRWIQAGKPSAYSPEGYSSVEAGLKWWDSFFAYIANDTSLAKGYENKGRTWLPDLEWIVNRTNFQKIIDGKYAK